MKMPTDPKWREAQLQAMLALGDAPQDAERVLAAMERLSPDDPTVLPDSEAFAAMFGQVTPDDVRDATADWMVRARPEWKRLLTATVKVAEFNPHHDALGRFATGGSSSGGIAQVKSRLLAMATTPRRKELAAAFDEEFPQAIAKFGLKPEQVGRMHIFGSYAGDKESPGDIDLLVEVPADHEMAGLMDMTTWGQGDHLVPVAFAKPDIYDALLRRFAQGLEGKPGHAMALKEIADDVEAQVTEWVRMLLVRDEKVDIQFSEFNPHHDALGRFAAGSAAVGLSYHALGRIGTQGRANVTSVRDALERLQTVKTPDSDWSYPLKQGDKLRGHLIGTDGVVKTVVGAWYKPDKLPPALSEADMTEGTIDVARSIAWHLERLTDADAARFCEEAGLAPLTAGEFREQWTGDTWDDLAMLLYIRREEEPDGE